MGLWTIKTTAGTPCARRVPAITGFLLCTLLWATLWSLPARATDIYVYEAQDGSRLITDHPRMEPGYRLIRVYSEAGTYRQAAPSPRVVAAKPLPSAYDDLIEAVARQASLDPLLIKSVMHAESAFNPNAVSRKGASGLMQLMPGTAQRYGVARIFDPHENILGGARYLRDLLKLFGGDLKLALAGYNAGEGAVLDRGGVPPYSETRRYISRVMRLYRAYQNERCAKRRDNMAAVDGRIISCSGSDAQRAAASFGVSSLSSGGGAGDPGRKPAPANAVSSAGEDGWRVVE